MDEHVIELLPAYALDCLDEEETVRVSTHLAACPTCCSELAAFQKIADCLPQAVPQVEPPAELKSRLLDRVQTPSESPKKRSGWARWLAGFGPAWGAASLALVALLLVSNVLLWQRSRRLEAVSPVLNVVNLSATDYAPKARALLVVSADGEHGTLVVDGLPDLGQEHQYQLWLIRNGVRTSGGVFSVDPDGYSSLWVSSPQPLADYSGFGVTVEPVGGSLDPTGERVLAGGF